MLDEMWEKFKKVGKAVEFKKKTKAYGLGKTRGASSKDADEAIEELEKEGKQYASEE